MAEIKLKNKAVDLDKLKNFDCKKIAEGYLLEKNICDSQFIMQIKISADGKIFLAWHMNKKSWFTIRLDGSVSTEKIFDKLKKSYTLAVK